MIGIAGLFLMLSSQHSELFSTKALGGLYKLPIFNLIVQTLLAIGFMLACMNMMLRRNRVLGFSAIVVVFLATMIGGMASSAAATDPDGSNLNNK